MASTFLFEVMSSIVEPLVTVSRDEHYDDHTSLKEALRYIYSKVSMSNVVFLCS